MEDSQERFVASLDIGTTTVRCQILNSKAKCIAAAVANVTLHYPQPGYVEIVPDQLWSSVCHVIQQAINDAHLPATRITCLAIATQRATFLTWTRDEQRPLHNFITWQDMRADKLVRKWNNSLTVRGLRTASYLLYLVSRHARYLAGSNLVLENAHVTMRLLWVLQHTPGIAEHVQRDNLMYGTVDTWIVYKLTAGKTYATDYASASATALFDPFIMNWSLWPLKLFKIPESILPPLVANDGDFGCTAADLFGAEIPIKCVISDQSAAAFGTYCHHKNDLKATLGTGTFLDMHTGDEPYASMAGLYPIIGWKFDTKLPVYLAEGACSDAGSLVQWAMAVGLFDEPKQTAAIAQQVAHNDGVYFVPAFSGLGPPLKDDNAGSGFIGLKPTSTKAHMTRAILESIVFRIRLLYKILIDVEGVKHKRIRVDGGVANNDFVCQMLADISGLEVERGACTEGAILGAAFIAGLNAGVWHSLAELNTLDEHTKTFQPNQEAGVKAEQELQKWLGAVERFMHWYKRF